MPSPIPAISEDYSDIIVKTAAPVPDRGALSGAARRPAIQYPLCPALGKSIRSTSDRLYQRTKALHLYQSLQSGALRHPFCPDTALSQTPRNRNSHRFSRLRHRLPAPRLPKSRRNDPDRCSLGSVRFNRNCTGRFFLWQ